MDVTSLGNWCARKWPGLLSLDFSWTTYACWSRYAAIHWHGPRGDWIGALFGENMITYLDASGWTSLLAVLLALAQMITARRRHTEKGRLFEFAVLGVSLAAAVMGWLAMT